MNFSSNWKVVSNSHYANDGLLITSEGNHTLIITDLSSSQQTRVERVDLVSDNFKYQCEVLWYLQNVICPFYKAHL